jgi:hypothetical protein
MSLNDVQSFLANKNSRSGFKLIRFDEVILRNFLFRLQIQNEELGGIGKSVVMCKDVRC